MAFAIVSVQMFLAQAYVLGRDFRQFIVIEVSQHLFQAHLAKGGQEQGIVGTGGTHVGQFLFFADIDDQIVIFFVFSNNHSHINLFTGIQKQSAAVLQVVERIGGGETTFKGDQNAVVPAGQWPTMWDVIMKAMA